MKKKCIFRCQFNGHCYRVYAVSNMVRGKEFVYIAYKGRRKLHNFPYDTFEGALGQVLIEYSGINFDTLNFIWS